MARTWRCRIDVIADRCASQACVEIGTAIIFQFAAAANGECRSYGDGSLVWPPTSYVSQVRQVRTLTHARFTLELGRLLVIVDILSYSTYAGAVRDLAFLVDTEFCRWPRFRASKSELVRVGRVLVNWTPVGTEGEGTATSWTLCPTTRKEAKNASRGSKWQSQHRKRKEGSHGC